MDLTAENVSTPNVDTEMRTRPTQPGQRHSTNDPVPNSQQRSRARNRPKHIPHDDNDSAIRQNSNPRRQNPDPASDNNTTSSSKSRAADTHNATRRQPRRRNPPNATMATISNTPADPTTIPSENMPRKEGSSRRSRFGAGLTQPEPTELATSRPSRKHKGKALYSNNQGDDLISTLIRGFTSTPYHDCPICFSSIRPDQATWSCSPSIPLVHNAEQGLSQYCWTSFHVKCIRSWADKSMKDVAEAWRARGEPDKKGDWRCPGCQAKRDIVPSGYWCFCHSTSEPKPIRLATPHSCGNSCARPRESGCGHPCPLQCHPGPCPPCQITTHPECYCPLKKVLAFRCGVDANAERDLSCGNICKRTLDCKKHTCERVCHSGECDKCQVKDEARCWCGKEEKEIGCAEGKEEQCFVEGQSPWIGSFSCNKPCQRFFDCGIHKCEKLCHPPSSTPDLCPRSPSQITHCPCGKSTIAPNSSVDQSLYTYPSRADCTSPVPTCNSVCSKPNSTCSHPCKAKCHTGPCAPCTAKILRPCRCGSTTRSLFCYEAYKSSNSSIEEKDILCDKPCAALRACGRHQCRRICCPLASLANAGKKGRRRVVEDGFGIGEEYGGLHECDLVCGKMLSCGSHKCEERDHKGACRPCMRSSFEELVCSCGLTIYDPPIPCGTVMQCSQPCARPDPPCGHPTIPHTCHEDSVSCPPCPFLTIKLCACGKKSIQNVRCSLETDKVFCGTVCGQLMGCGFHHCQRLCHSGECGDCTASCGKARKSCLPDFHPCTRACHAPSTCPETEPCESLITLTCPCGRIRQPVLCAQTTSHHSGHFNAAPRCSNECQIAKRNARLADAFGINQESNDNKSTGVVTYSDELTGYARVNMKFLALVEKTFQDFVSSEKRATNLPHMPADRRKFVHDLARVYRMDTQMVDQEPHRSVQAIRRIDTRVPTPLLSDFIAPTSGLGKLADLRTLKGAGPSSSPPWRPAAATAMVTPIPKPWNNTTQGSRPTPTRGWTPVVTSGTSASTSSSALAPKPPYSEAPSSTSLLGASGPSLSRTASPAHLPSEPVPENWEDDI